MLQLRLNCECCNRDLPPESLDAMICSFECTFCAQCVATVLHGRCPNCSGEFVRRPIRPVAGARPLSSLCGEDLQATGLSGCGVAWIGLQAAPILDLQTASSVKPVLRAMQRCAA